MVRPLFVVGILVLVLGATTPGYAAPQTTPMQIDPYDYQTLTPSDPVGAVRSTRELIAAGKMSEAVHHLEVYVYQHPYEVGPRRFLGDLYVRVGQIERAGRIRSDPATLAKRQGSAQSPRHGLCRSQSHR